MANTTFVDYQLPVINAAWLNDVNDNIYDGNPAIPGTFRYSLGLGTGGLGVGYTTPYTGGVLRTVLNKLSEQVSVTDFGALGNGATDDTAAFIAAIATGKKVFVPYTASGYVVNNIPVVGGMHIEGEKANGSLLNTRLIVTLPNASAFVMTSNAFMFDCTFRNLACTAALTGTNANFFRQTDKTVYSTYFIFDNIDTFGTLALSYDGWFIFSQWNNCRDAFHGTALAGQQHYAISSVPAAFGQATQTNLCQLRSCQFFNATSGAPAAVDIAYGANWHFEDCDFEGNLTYGLRARGIMGLSLESNWYENTTATCVIKLEPSPGPGAQGCIAASIRGGHGGLTNTTQCFVSLGGACEVAIHDLSLISVPVGVVLTDVPSRLTALSNVRGVSGPGAATFVTNATYAGVPQQPQSAPFNMLPIGPGGLGVANFSLVGITVKTDIASGIGLAGQAMEFTLSGVANIAYYQIPSKLVTFLRGKTITVSMLGFAGTANVADNMNAAIWDSVVPAGGNGVIGTVANAGSTQLQLSYVTTTVGAAATSLAIGVVSGGANATKTIKVETMAMYLGTIAPEGMSIR